MLKTLLTQIPDDGISYQALASMMVSWSTETFDAVISRAVLGGHLTRGQGGGGGVLRRSSSEDRTSDRQDQFTQALEKLTKGDYSKGIKSEALRKKLKWDEATFRTIRQSLKEQESISVSRGPGGLIYLIDNTTDTPDTPDTLPSSPEQQTTKASTKKRKTPGATAAQIAPQGTPSLHSAKAVEPLLAELLEKLKQLQDADQSATNGVIAESLGWSKYQLWQVRASATKKGLISYKHGDHGTITLHTTKVTTPPNALGTQHQQSIFLHLGAQGEKAIRIQDLGTEFGLSSEQTVTACAHLIDMKLVTPVKGGLIKLSADLSPASTAPTDTLELLRAFQAPILSLGAAGKHLKWPEDNILSAIEKCTAHTPALLSFDEYSGILTKTDAAEKFLEKYREVEAGGPCVSPKSLKVLQRLLNSKSVIAFVGAGACVEAGLPSWASLLTGMVDDSIDKRHRHEIIDLLKHDLIGAASAIEDLISGPDFTRRIQRALSTDRCIYPSTATIFALSLLADKLQGIITTNLDHLIEATLGRTAAAPLSPQTLQSRLASSIIHTHGVLDRPETWLITRSQYNKTYYTAPYTEALAGLFSSSHHLMFIGYGMRDYEINLVFDRIEGTYGSHHQPEHFFFMKASEANTSPYFIRRLKRLGMTPILFRDFPDLPLLLAQLALGKA